MAVKAMSTAVLGEGDKGKAKPMSSETPVVRVPVWLWTLMGIAVAFAFSHTVRQHITEDRVNSLREEHSVTTSEIDKINEELNRQSGVLDSVNGIATDLRDIRTLVREVRDDVLILKTREKNPILKSN